MVRKACSTFVADFAEVSKKGIAVQKDYMVSYMVVELASYRIQNKSHLEVLINL